MKYGENSHKSFHLLNIYRINGGLFWKKY